MKNRIKAKIMRTKTEYKTFPYQNNLILTNIPICSICKKPIDNDTNVYLCSNFDQIFHIDCFNPKEHINSILNPTEIISRYKHIDWLCRIIIVPLKPFIESSYDEIDINIDIVKE